MNISYFHVFHIDKVNQQIITVSCVLGTIPRDKVALAL